MLNVLQVIPTLDRSGAEKQMVLLATGLPRDRFRVEVAALTRLGPLEADLKAAGVPVTLIGKRGKLDPRTHSRLTRLMKARKLMWCKHGSSPPMFMDESLRIGRGCPWW